MLGLVPTPPAMPEGVAWAAHTLQYMVLMLWFGGIYPARHHLLIATGIVIVGIAIEVAQAASIFRTFDLKDIAANIAGVIAGLLLVQTVLRDWCRRVENRLPGPGA
ncbi:MAG: VanZ family protein [Gammaproteobacteria bacterium]|nr:VanZ family protein [Gammaproteobacteria bacterium]